MHHKHKPGKLLRLFTAFFKDKLTDFMHSLLSNSSNRNQFSIFERNQGPMKAIAAPQNQQPPPRMPPQPPPNWNGGQPPMPVPPLPPGGSFVSVQMHQLCIVSLKKNTILTLHCEFVFRQCHRHRSGRQCGISHRFLALIFHLFHRAILLSRPHHHREPL